MTNADQIALARDALRDEARARLGVTRESGKTEGFRSVCRSYGLSYYPLVAISILGIVDTFQAYAFQVLAPDISRGLGIGIGSILGISALYQFSLLLSPLGAARAAQHSHRRAFLCVSTGLAWSFITLFTGFVTSLAGLLFILVFDGLTTGTVVALHQPLVVDSYPPAGRVRAVSFYNAAFYGGNLAAPLLVAVLASAAGLSWRGVFLAMGLTSVGLTLLCLRLRDPGFGRWDTEQVRAAVHEASGETAAASTGEEYRLGFWESCRRVIMTPTAWRILIGQGVVGALVVPLNTFISFFLDQRWNLGAADRGLFLASYFGGSAVGLAVYGRRGERLFRRSPASVLVLAPTLLGVAVVLIALGGLAPRLPLMWALFVLSGAFFGPVAPSLAVAYLSIVRSDMRAHAQGLAAIFVGIGGFVGSLFFAGIDRRFGIGGSLVAVCIPGLIGAAVMLSASRHVESDLDRMIDDLVEDEEVGLLRSKGVHLPMLACRRIDFSYGSLQVLFDVDFTVDEGEMVALLGVNGAGKSTLLKVVSGIGLPSAGSVRFQGHDITYLDAERRLRLGITQIPGGRAVFGPLSVIENLRLFGYTLGKDKRAVERAIDESLAAFPRLAERRNNLASTLSGGEQQMLGLSKALILRPQLLLIDELSLGLAPIIVGQLLEMVRRINTTGTAVVLVEQSVNIALNLVDHAYFMEKGEMRFNGPAADLLARDDLLRAVFLSGAGAAT